MSFLSLMYIEFTKIRGSRILPILFAATVILWIPSILNADMNFTMQSRGIYISPENNFFIQGFMGMAWFMFPASMVVVTVMINQMERTGNGILKMLAMPVSTVWLCLAKFIVFLTLAALQVLMMTGMYYLSAAIASYTQSYNMLLPLQYVAKEAGVIYLAAIPMLAFFWMLSVCIRTPIFSIGVGLVSIVPSILAINTRAWFLYPMAYQFYIIANRQGQLTENFVPSQIEFIPLIPVAAVITIICLCISCLRFGQAERR